jgi:protein-disulfide isomerase
MNPGWQWRARRAGIGALAAGLLALAAFAGNSGNQTAKKPASSAKPASSESDDLATKAIGSKSAPITMEVFSDYECPSCGALYEQTLKPMISDYVASGKVYLVHRDFPLPMHKYSHDAARWVNAAAHIGRYPEVEAGLYDNQAAWTASGDLQKYVSGALSPADFKRVAKLMEPCVSQAAAVKPASATPQAAHACPFDTSIDKDIALGNTVPVTATPTFRFFYKGQTYGPTSGFVAWPLLKQFFDSLLAQ